MIEAQPDCCEECAMGLGFSAYIPCNKPATKIIGWPHCGEKNLRMCEMCADHNIRNRSGTLIGPYVPLAEQEIPQ